MNIIMTTSPKLIRDLMSVGVPTCGLDDLIGDITRWFLEKDIEGVVVLDANGHGAGVVTRDELVKAYAHGNLDQLRAGNEQLTAEQIMEVNIPRVPPDIPLQTAAQIMQDLGVRVLFLTHHAGGIEYPAAFLTYNHLLRHLAAQDEKDLRDLGIAAERESPIDTFIRRRDEALRRAQSNQQAQRRQGKR